MMLLQKLALVIAFCCFLSAAVAVRGPRSSRRRLSQGSNAAAKLLPARIPLPVYPQGRFKDWEDLTAAEQELASVGLDCKYK